MKLPADVVVFARWNYSWWGRVTFSFTLRGQAADDTDNTDDYDDTDAAAADTDNTDDTDNAAGYDTDNATTTTMTTGSRCR